MKKIAFLALFFLMLTIIFVSASCKKNIEKEPSSVVKKTILGFSQLGSESSWREANTESIRNAAKEANFELIFSNAQQKQENQIKAIRSFIAQQVDAIAFSPLVETGWDAVLTEAREARIPVILADRGISVKDKSLYVTLIGSDFLAEGRKAGNWLVEKFGDRTGDIRIVELQGTAGSAPTIDRKRGFEEAIKANPGMKIVRSDYGDFMRSKGKEVMLEILNEMGPDIEVLYSHNDDMALGAIEAIEERGLRPGRDIIIVSIDGVKGAFEAMIEGRLNCTVECNPLLGPQLMQAVKDILAGKSVPKRIVTEEGVFPQETAQKELPNRKY